MIWLAAGALSLLVAALVLRPLWRARTPSASEAPEIAFYRDQLAEIERDAASGELTPEQAHSARLEVQRRLLAVAAPAVRDAAPVFGPMLGGARLALAVPLVVVLLAGSLALYLEIGSPGAITLLGIAVFLSFRPRVPS